MTALLSFKDNPLQKEFVFNKSKFSAYFGKVRGGKTVGGCARVLMFAELFPGNEILVGRQTYPQLYETTARELIGMVKKRNGGSLDPGPYLYKYIQGNSGPDQQTLFIKTKGEPSRIRLRYLDDVDSVLGAEYGVVYIDQAEGVNDLVFRQLKNRLTYWNTNRIAEFKERYSYTPKSFLFVTGNPDPGWAFEEFKVNAQGEYFFLETNIQENSHNLPPGYFDELIKNNPPSWVDRFLRNDWTVKGGQVFKEFDERIHGVPSFPIPDHWTRILAMDYGFSHPSAVYWVAIDEQGRLYYYKELFVSGWIASQIAEAIKEMSQFTGPDGKKHWERVPKLNDHVIVYMPRDMNKHDGIVNRTVQEEFALYGVQGLPANQSVEAGILKMQERLHAKTLFIFKDKCPALMRGMKTYVFDEVTGKVVKRDDDAVDGARYACMAALEQKSEGPAPEMKSVLQAEFSKYMENYIASLQNNTGSPIE